MSNGVVSGITKLFDFLAQTCGISSSAELIDQADTNGDYILTKGEFRKFMENWGGDYTESELTQFWNTLDTKTNGNVGGTGIKELNALDSNELDKVDKYLQAYTAIDECVNELLKDIPATVGQLGVGKNLRASLSESLKNSLNSIIKANINANNLIDIVKEKCAELGKTALAKTIANEYAQKLLNDAIKNDPDLKKAGYAGGDDIQNIISSFVRTLNIDEDIDYDALFAEVKNIVSEFLSTKNPSNTDFSTLENYGYYSDGMNSLQEAIVTNEMTNAINPSSFTDFEDEINELLTNFISSHSYSDFMEIKDGKLVVPWKE